MAGGPLVKCEVNTCVHWLPEDICAAENIDILHEEEGKMAKIAEQTECKTFQERRGLANMVGGMDNVDWGGMLTEYAAEGRQANPTVTCIVDSCKYWVDGDLCEADTIEVSGQNASECQATNCETFENNGAGGESSKKK